MERTCLTLTFEVPEVLPQKKGGREPSSIWMETTPIASVNCLDTPAFAASVSNETH